MSTTTNKLSTLAYPSEAEPHVDYRRANVLFIRVLRHLHSYGQEGYWKDKMNISGWTHAQNKGWIWSSKKDTKNIYTTIIFHLPIKMNPWGRWMETILTRNFRWRQLSINAVHLSCKDCWKGFSLLFFSLSCICKKNMKRFLTPFAEILIFNFMG